MPRAKRKQAPIKAPPKVVLRPHQLEAREQFLAGKRNQLHVWHRRGGKDWYGLSLASEQMRTKVGSYWHLLPKHAQAKRAIWNGIDHQSGRKFLDLFFPDRTVTNAQDMYLETPEGSSYQLLGSDNYDRVVGSNPRGIIFSEWALCNPRALDYFRPIITANKGWMIFISTFRGRNHHWQMYNTLLDNPEWYVTLKTVDDTGLITEEDIQKDRDAGMSDRLVDQEYYCKPAPPTSLGPFARVHEGLEAIGNIREVLNPNHSANYIAVGCSGEYVAVVECSVRGSVQYIHGGNVFQNVALQEALEGKLTKILGGDSLLAVDDDLTQDARGLSLPLRQPLPASQAEAVTFFERSIIAPTSVVSAACNGSLNLWVDEEADPDTALEAVYAAMTRLASLRPGALLWGKPTDYTLSDKAVICGHRPNSLYRY